MTTDVLIIIALSEEADELTRTGFFGLSDEIDLETFKYQTFSFRDRDGTRRSGALICTGEVGQRTRDAATLFCNQSPTRMVLNVGISGRVKDVAVGDVIVPTYVNAPSHRSSIEDDVSGGYREAPGGKPLEVSSHALAIVKSKAFRSDIKLPTLMEFAKRDQLELSNSERDYVEERTKERIVAARPSIVEGPFAAGQAVIKSQNFKQQVLGKIDRNIIALDMESAFIAAALANFTVRPEFFAIRAISDPADSRKPEFDAIGSGLFRRWAMSNIRSTLKSFLEKSEIFTGPTDEDLASSLAGKAHYDYQSTYPGQFLLDLQTLNSYDDRFANIRIPGHKGATFTSVLQRLKGLPKGGRVLVAGRGGSGKSALLKKMQIELGKDPNIETVFINTRKILDRCISNDVAQLIDDKLMEVDYSDARKLYIFLDEFYGDDREIKVLSHISENLAFRGPVISIAFGQDHFDALSIKGDSEASAHVYDKQYDLGIEVKAISISNRPLAIRVIQGLLRTSHEAAGIEPEIILNNLIDMGFPYMNHFVVSLYLENYKKKSFANLNSTQFVIHAMKIFYEEIYAKDQTFEQLCVEALRAHCRTLARFGVPAGRQSPSERYHANFVHFPRIVQTNLIANAIVYILRMFDGYGETIFSKVGIGRDDFFGLVFDGDVNNSVKGLLADLQIEQRVISSANKLSENADEKGLSYALYLFGRAHSPGALRIAEDSMERLAPQIRIPAKESRNGTDRPLAQDKFWRLARRSWHISKSLRGDRIATDQYIEFVLNDPYEDELNRSFHLEYYGDYKKIGVTVDLELKDAGGDWRRTRDVLARRIERILVSRQLEEYDRICLLTYYSLVRYRQELGKLTADERAEAARLLEAILMEALSLRPQLSGFLNMMASALKSDRYNWIDAVVEIFKLKSLPRFGWVSREMFLDKPHIETITSHTCGAMILAEWLAGHVKPDITEEQRFRLMRILLHHDLGEAYIGDFAPTDGITKQKEPPAIERMASLSTFREITRIKHIRYLFEDYEKGGDPIAALARDFDKLDAVIQGYIYAKRFPSTANRDEFFDYYLSKIANDKMQQLAEEVIARAKKLRIEEMPER